MFEPAELVPESFVGHDCGTGQKCTQDYDSEARPDEPVWPTGGLMACVLKFLLHG